MLINNWRFESITTQSFVALLSTAATPELKKIKGKILNIWCRKRIHHQTPNNEFCLDIWNKIWFTELHWTQFLRNIHFGKQRNKLFVCSTLTVGSVYVSPRWQMVQIILNIKHSTPVDWSSNSFQQNRQCQHVPAKAVSSTARESAPWGSCPFIFCLSFLHVWSTKTIVGMYFTFFPQGPNYHFSK